jgi:hypothetical protein
MYLGAMRQYEYSGFFLLAWQPNQSAKVHRWLEHHLWSAYMCDYSLHTVANRPAEVAETLVTTKFRCSGTRGFASPTDSDVAVCLRPGTEIAFEKEVQTGGLIFRKDIGDRLARFRQINLDRPAQHHDALEFSNGAIVLVTNLASGQGLQCCNCLQNRCATHLLLWHERRRQPGRSTVT